MKTLYKIDFSNFTTENDMRVNVFYDESTVDM